jgi:DNA processing protein
MAERDEALEWVALSLIPGVGGETFRRLLTTFGTPDRIFAAGTPALSTVVSHNIASAIAAGVNDLQLDPFAHWLEEPNNHVVTLADAEYPKALLEIADPPPLLYVKGALGLLMKPSLAIVGSRNASTQGKKDAERFAQALSDAGLCVVSGLALGIDAAAHRGGLAGLGSSIAVVGTGLDIVYPAANRALAHQLAESGALVSEFPLGVPSKAHNFPRRNRIISGLAQGVLIVEAAIRSGSLITARLAGEQGREVFAIPGSIHSPLAKGCHQLIKQGAKLVESAEDVLEELGWRSKPAVVADASQASDERPHGVLLAQLGFEPCTVDTLVERTGLTAEKLSSILLELELAGLVASLPGGLYQVIH